MSENDQGRSGRGGAAVRAIGKISTEICRAVRLPQGVRFSRLVRHVHGLGPRPVGELLLELADDAHGIEGDILARLEKFAELDPAAVARLGGRIWPPLPLSEVA